MKLLKLLASSFLLPFVANAQVAALRNTNTLATNIDGLITDTLVPLAFMLALLFFFWGIAKYIYSEGEGKGEGKKIMVWGVVAMFVISSVWGIVYFIQKEVGVGEEEFSLIPTAQ